MSTNAQNKLPPSSTPASCEGADDVVVGESQRNGAVGRRHERRGRNRNGGPGIRGIEEEDEVEDASRRQEHHHHRQTSEVSTDTSLSSLSVDSNSSGSEAMKPRFRTPADQLVNELFETIKAKKSNAPPKSLQLHSTGGRPAPVEEVFTLSSFQQQRSHEDLSFAADGSISSLRKIWETDPGGDNQRQRTRPTVPSKPATKEGLGQRGVIGRSSSSNVYAAPSELYAGGLRGSKTLLDAGGEGEVVYADREGVIGQAKELQGALSAAVGRQQKHDKVSLTTLADRVERFRNVCTHYADNVSATGRFRFRAQLNRLGQMAKELVFLATRSPQHGAKPIIQEIELITEDLVVLMKK